MNVWTKAQEKAFQGAIAAADKHEKAVQVFMEIAKVSPIFKQSVEDLVTLHEHTRLLAETALAAALQALQSDDQSQVR